MLEYINILSNREKALLVWILIVLIAMMLGKEIRKSIFGVFKALFVKQILAILGLFGLYVFASVSLLKLLGFWDASLLKDTILWAFGAFVIMFKVDKAKDRNHFTDLIKDSIKWAVIFEFLVAFYTFSFRTELILIPVLVFTGMLQATASFDPKHKQVEEILKKFVSFIGIIIIGYVIFKTYNQYKDLLSIAQLKTFLLPIVLTILFLPFVYGLAIYMVYESIFIRLLFIIKDKKLRDKTKNIIIKIANIDIGKLNNISHGIFLGGINSEADLPQKVIALSKGVNYLSEDSSEK
jgi:hypothetical protein